jgi:hypothetical protein
MRDTRERIHSLVQSPTPTPVTTEHPRYVVGSIERIRGNYATPADSATNPGLSPSDAAPARQTLSNELNHD